MLAQANFIQQKEVGGSCRGQWEKESARRRTAEGVMCKDAAGELGKNTRVQVTDEVFVKWNNGKSSGRSSPAGSSFLVMLIRNLISSQFQHHYICPIMSVLVLLASQRLRYSSSVIYEWTTLLPINRFFSWSRKSTWAILPLTSLTVVVPGDPHQRFSIFLLYSITISVETLGIPSPPPVSWVYSNVITVQYGVGVELPCYHNKWWYTL